MLKKILAVTLSMVLLLTTFPNVFNAEINEEDFGATVVNDEEVREMLLSKAIEAFPEYEKEIRGENEINLGKARSGGMGEVVINETRRLSETDVVTYTQYDSGIATAAVGLAIGKKYLTSHHRGQYILHEMNVWLTCGSSEDVLFVESFGYGVYTNDYDEIIYQGVFNDVLCTILSPFIESCKIKEDIDSPARISYSGYFRFNNGEGQMPYQIYGRLIIEVANDTYTLSSSN